MVLMVLSAALAFFIPFKLFLFAYAVLGPLHYLTEISWLDKRNFFIKQKYDIWLFALMAILLTVPWFNPHTKFLQLGTTFIFTAFFFALIIFFVQHNILKYALTLIVFFLSYGLRFDKNESIMLPTIIHVFLFTGFFILFGALKSKSSSGLFSLLVFVACALSFFIVHPGIDYEQTDPYIQSSMDFFSVVNKSLLYIFNMDGVDSFRSLVSYPKEHIFTQPAAIVVARFIAFAYTNHYLNWFSKTTVIKWHEVSKTRLWLIAALWIISVGLYALDYSKGFKLLFLLSMMHVFFEFPLNLYTIKGIVLELKGKAGMK